VEVIGRYSNHLEQGELLEHVLNSVPEGAPGPKTPTRKQVHRRLRDDQIDDLVAKYKRGYTVYQLANEFAINRETVSLTLRRRGVAIDIVAWDPDR